MVKGKVEAQQSRCHNQYVPSIRIKIIKMTPNQVKVVVEISEYR